MWWGSVVPYKITWFRRGWVGLGQLIWVIVVPMLGHLGVYSWFGGHCGGIIKESGKGYHQIGISKGRATDVRSCLRQDWAVLRTVLQIWTKLYGHPHGICRFIGLYGRRMQLFLVLATYCVVLGPIPSAEHLIERTLTHLSPWRSCTATAHPP